MALLDLDFEDYATTLKDFEARNKKLDELFSNKSFFGKRRRRREINRLLDAQDPAKVLFYMFMQAYLDENASEMQIVPGKPEEEGCQPPYDFFVMVNGKREELIPPPRHIVPHIFQVFQSYTEKDGSFQAKYLGKIHNLQTRLENGKFTLSR